MNFGSFLQAFARDHDYHDPYPRNAYLDKATGEVLWVYDDDFGAFMESGTPEADNRKLAMMVRSAPEQFVRIPGFSHGQNHEIFEEFFDTQWTDDEQECERVRNTYFKSIGGWMKTVGSPAAVDAFEEFRRKRQEQLAEDFLKSHGFTLTR